MDTEKTLFGQGPERFFCPVPFRTNMLPSLLFRSPLVLLFLFRIVSALAQDKGDQGPGPEFPQGWRFPLELAQGPVPSTGAYAGWATIGASYTLVPGHLRLGARAGPGLFGDRGVVLGGARLAWRVKTFHTPFGSWGNAQLVAEHLWSTRDIALLGGGAVVEAGELVLVGLKAYWPYGPDSDAHPLWMQLSLGLHILKGKPAPGSDDPFSNP